MLPRAAATSRLCLPITVRLSCEMQMHISVPTTIATRSSTGRSRQSKTSDDVYTVRKSRLRAEPKRSSSGPHRYIDRRAQPSGKNHRKPSSLCKNGTGLDRAHGMISEEKADVVADEVLLDACLYAHARSSIAPLVCRESEDCTIS